MKNKKILNWDKKTEYVYNAVLQCMVIFYLVWIFFLMGKNSKLYSSWDVSFKGFVSTGSMVTGIVCVVLLLLWLSLYIRNQSWKNRKYDFIGIGMMVIIHYFIRVDMVGTIQMEEGLSCYNSIKNMVYNPEIILDNFIEGTRIADKISYGYAFFALMFEFMMPGAGYGFQWAQMFMGIAAACCLYEIFKMLFPKLKRVIAWVAAFVVSAQPMFLGFSTMCSLEYGLVVFYIYALYCCLKKRYILMGFWLIMLCGTKGMGVITAMCFLCAYVVAIFFARYIDEENHRFKKFSLKAKLFSVLVVAVMFLFFFVILFFSNKNGISFNAEHIKLKLAHLFVLNMGWIWSIVVVIGLVMVTANQKIKMTHRMEFIPMVVLVITYFVYVAYLLFYSKAALPRYDMLADVIFVIFGVFLLIKMFERKNAILSSLGILAFVMLGQAFVNIDPVSTELFTVIETNSFPMLHTASFKSDKEIHYDNAGDFGCFNYQYTFVDKAIDDILWRFNWYSAYRVVSAYDGCEAQFYYDDLLWDTYTAKRAYAVGEGSEERYQYIGRSHVDTLLAGSSLPERAVFVDSPWCSGDTEGAIEKLSVYYDIEGPMESKQGFAGSVIYYFLELK